MKKADHELVVVPAPGISHLVPTIEFAKTLIHRDHRLSLTLLIIHDASRTIAPPLRYSHSRLRFIDLPSLDPPDCTKSGLARIGCFVEQYKSHVRDAIARLVKSAESAENDSAPLAGLVLDMFTTTMADVALEFGVPSYVYGTSSAAVLGHVLHVPILDAQITTELKDYDGELAIPSFRNSVPPLALPSTMWNKKDEAYAWVLFFARKIKEAKGVIVNSFADLEPYAIGSFENGRSEVQKPQIYPVGPMLDLSGQVLGDGAHFDDIMHWLDNQPRSSVIFLCFGSMGTLGAAQVKEIAIGLERSGHNFLWSLRNYTNPEKVFPEGFLERTAGRGLICGWAPQVAVLGHEAIGCFVSHCGWNSVLESVWFGVPLLTWPLYAEQKLNAFVLVRELGVAKELRGWSKGDGEVTSGDEVERCVRSVMEGESEVVLRERVKEMRENSRKAVMEGGSSFITMGHLIEDLIRKDP